MDNGYKVYPHNPPHYFVPNAIYMVTGAILHNRHLLFEDRRKQIVLEVLLSRSQALGWNMVACAILHNHYHFIARSPASATTLPKLIRQLHSITAIELNKWDRTPGRQVWFNYWDTCITYERSYLARLHYVLMNPVKHGLVESPIDYPYCSYKWFVKQSDQDLQSLVFDQPIDKVNIFDEF